MTVSLPIKKQPFMYLLAMTCIIIDLKVDIFDYVCKKNCNIAFIMYCNICCRNCVVHKNI